MPTAFVLINTQLDDVEEILDAVKKVRGIEEAYIVYGGYDIITRVIAETMNELREIVPWRIRHIKGVRSTQTMIVVSK